MRTARAKAASVPRGTVGGHRGRRGRHWGRHIARSRAVARCRERLCNRSGHPRRRALPLALLRWLRAAGRRERPPRPGRLAAAAALQQSRGGSAAGTEPARGSQARPTCRSREGRRTTSCRGACRHATTRCSSSSSSSSSGSSRGRRLDRRAAAEPLRQRHARRQLDAEGGEGRQTAGGERGGGSGGGGVRHGDRGRQLRRSGRSSGGFTRLLGGQRTRLLGLVLLHHTLQGRCGSCRDEACACALPVLHRPSLHHRRSDPCTRTGSHPGRRRRCRLQHAPRAASRRRRRASGACGSASRDNGPSAPRRRALA